jgi:hypothetical protein
MANEHYYALSTLRTKVRNQLDEVSPSFWSEDQLTDYINRAKNRVRNRLKALNEYYVTATRTSLDGSITYQGETYACTGFQIAAGTSDYTLPPDFASMATIECITSGFEDLTFTALNMNHPDFRAARAFTDNQSPLDEVFFCIFGEPASMRIAPKLDRTLDLRITYQCNLADLSADADVLTLPNPAYIAVVDYATMYALRQDRSPDAGTYEQSGDKLIAEEFGADSRQTQDVQTARGYLEN